MARSTQRYFNFRSLLALISIIVSLSSVALALYITIVYNSQPDSFCSLRVSTVLYIVSELSFCVSCIIWTLISDISKSNFSKKASAFYILFIGFIILLSFVSMGATAAIVNLFIKYAKQTAGISISENYRYIVALVPLLVASQFLKGSFIFAHISFDYSNDLIHVDPDNSYASKEFTDTQSFAHNITEISPIAYRSTFNYPYQQSKEKLPQVDSSLTISSNNINTTSLQKTSKHFSAYNTTPPLTQHTSSSTTSLTTSEANIENSNKNNELLVSKSQLSPIQEPDNSFNSLNNDLGINQGGGLNFKSLQSEKILSPNNLREGNPNTGVKLLGLTKADNSFARNNSTPFYNTYHQTAQNKYNQIHTTQTSETTDISQNAVKHNLSRQTPGLNIFPNHRRTTLRKPSVPIPHIPSESERKDELSLQESETSSTYQSQNHSNNSLEHQRETKKSVISVETKWSHKQDGHDMASINTASLWPFIKSPTESRMSPTFGHFHRENMQKRVILPKVVKMDASAMESKLNMARTDSLVSQNNLSERDIQPKNGDVQDLDFKEDFNEISYSASVIEKPDDNSLDNMFSDSISVFPKSESENLCNSDEASHERGFLDLAISENNNNHEVNRANESILKKIKRRSSSPLKKVISQKSSSEKTRIENRRQILNTINNSSSMKEKLNNSPIKKRISNFSSLGNIDFDFIKHDGNSTSSDSSDYLDIIKNYNNENDNSESDINRNDENVMSKRSNKFKRLSSKMKLDTIRSVFNQDSTKHKSENINEPYSFTVYRRSDENDNMNFNTGDYNAAWDWSVEDSTKNFVNGIMHDKDAEASSSDSSDDDNSENYSKNIPFEIPGFKSNDHSNNNHDTSVGSYFNEEFSNTEEYDKPHEYSDVPSNTTVSKFSHMVSNSISLVTKKVHKREVSLATESQAADQIDDSAINAIENLRNSSDSFNFVDQTAASITPRSISEYNKEKLKILDS